MTELKTNTESPVLLNTVLTKSVVADMYEVNIEYAKNNIEEVCNEVEREFAGEDIIIRSLAVSEDNVFDNPSFEEPLNESTVENTITTNVPSNFDDLMSSLNEDVLNAPIKDDTAINVFGNNDTKKYSYDKGSENDDFVRNFFTTNKIEYDKIRVIKGGMPRKYV